MEPIESSEVKTSMLAYMTTFGVDDWLFIINIEIALLVTMLLKVYAWLLVAVALHFVLVMVTRMAPQLLECYVKHLRQADRYYPDVSPLQRRGLRPDGWRDANRWAHRPGRDVIPAGALP